MPKANRHKDNPGRLFRAAIPTPGPATTTTYCRDAATSARLDWGENWKSQRSDKLLKAYKCGKLPPDAPPVLRHRLVPPLHHWLAPPPSRQHLAHSHPRRRPPIHSDDDDDDGQGEDVFQPASDEDTEHNGGDEGEAENEMSEKARGKHKAIAQEEGADYIDINCNTKAKNRLCEVSFTSNDREWR
ncbi:hypothetical protein B0H14DRAFT_2625981 [Mycena olivaceomarginata]|nr:hypothetical protein B0H14DRAFT_2625981 [Mycena olivaceomarginata]